VIASSTLCSAGYLHSEAGPTSPWVLLLSTSSALATPTGRTGQDVFGFFQDDWKAARNLTVNLGVRYEWAGGPKEINGIISNLNLNNTQSYGARVAVRFGLLEQGKPSFKSNNNWGPRIGFAWNVGGSQKTVLRGGYGIAYDFIFLNPITNQRFLPPFIITGSLSGQSSFTGANSFANLVAGTAQLKPRPRLRWAS